MEIGRTLEFIGGNKGIKTPGENNTCGVYKHIYERRRNGRENGNRNTRQLPQRTVQIFQEEKGQYIYRNGESGLQN